MSDERRKFFRFPVIRQISPDKDDDINFDSEIDSNGNPVYSKSWWQEGLGVRMPDHLSKREAKSYQGYSDYDSYIKGKGIDYLTMDVTNIKAFSLHLFPEKCSIVHFFEPVNGYYSVSVHIPQRLVDGLLKNLGSDVSYIEDSALGISYK